MMASDMYNHHCIIATGKMMISFYIIVCLSVVTGMTDDQEMYQQHYIGDGGMDSQQMTTPMGTMDSQQMVTPEGQRMVTPESQLMEIMDQQEYEKNNSQCSGGEVTVDLSNCKLVCKCNGGPASCQKIYESNPGSKSGEYTLRVNGTNIKKYCKFGNIAGVEGGWTRVGKLNMKEQNSCPNGFALRQDSVIGKSCSRPNGGGGCTSVKFASDGIKYSRVSGIVTAYQFGTTDAFAHYVHPNKDYKVDDDGYVDGISITRGSNPRKHVFTLAGGYSENRQDKYGCPCNSMPAAHVAKPPDFVGKDYYCESGNPASLNRYELFNQDVLFDGKKCRSNEATCCVGDDKHFPYFYKDLRQVTSDSLEMRLCTDESTSNENVYITKYEFYVN